MNQQFNLNTVLLLFLIVIVAYVAYVVLHSLRQYIAFETKRLKEIDQEAENEEQEDFDALVEEIYFNAQKDYYYGHICIEYDNKTKKFKWIKGIQHASGLPDFKITKDNSKTNEPKYY